MRILQTTLARASKACLLAAAFSALAGAQTNVVGTVTGASENEISIDSGARKTTFSIDARTRVRKDRPIEPGDRAIVRYHAGAAGRLVADEVMVNLENHFAVITRVNGTSFEVLTNPNADPQSAYRKEIKTVRIDESTVFEGSAREDLKTGRSVQIIGVGNGNGGILATRVTVYEGNHPVRMRSDARIVLPDGSVR